MIRKMSALSLVITLSLAGCTTASPSTPKGTESTATKANPPVAVTSNQPDLRGVKNYLLTKATALRDSTGALKQTADAYFDLAKRYNFDYATLWQKEPQKVSALLLQAKKEFDVANPAYESMEGIVGGVPSLSQFDVNLDAGTAAAEDPQSAVDFDVKLPDGQVLAKPGNYFFLTELALWGTEPKWTAPNVKPDLDGNGKVEFGEVLPDANFLKGTMDGFATESADLLKAAEAWQPTKEDAFTALVKMTPTMDELFAAWKESHEVSGEKAETKQFVASSRLTDITDIISSLQVIYDGVQPLVDSVDATQADQVKTSLAGLHNYVSDIFAKQKGGKHYTPEEADTLGSEAQSRATAITGQLTQVAAKLNIKVEE